MRGVCRSISRLVLIEKGPKGRGPHPGSPIGASICRQQRLCERAPRTNKRRGARMADQRPSSSVVTFSRRRKPLEQRQAAESEPSAPAAGKGGASAGGDSSASSDAAATAASACTSATSYITAPSVLTPLAEVRAPGDASINSTADSGPAPAGAVAPRGAARRRRAPSLGRARAASHAQHMAELKAYFDEVGAAAAIVRWVCCLRVCCRPSSACSHKLRGVVACMPSPLSTGAGPCPNFLVFCLQTQVDAFELLVETPTPKKGQPRSKADAGDAQPAGEMAAAGLEACDVQPMQPAPPHYRMELRPAARTACRALPSSSLRLLRRLQMMARRRSSSSSRRSSRPPRPRPPAAPPRCGPCRSASPAAPPSWRCPAAWSRRASRGGPPPCTPAPAPLAWRLPTGAAAVGQCTTPTAVPHTALLSQTPCCHVS